MTAHRCAAAAAAASASATAVIGWPRFRRLHRRKIEFQRNTRVFFVFFFVDTNTGCRFISSSCPPGIYIYIYTGIGVLCIPWEYAESFAQGVRWFSNATLCVAKRLPEILRTMGGPKGRRRLEQGFLGAEHFLTPEGKLKVSLSLFPFREVSSSMSMLSVWWCSCRDHIWFSD